MSGVKEIMKEYFEKAEARGVAIGEARGVEKNAIANIRSLMETTHWSAKQAMDALKIPVGQQAQYASQL